MRILILAATVAAIALPASAASAQRWGGGYHYRDSEVRRELRECRRELRRADSRREYRRERRECRRELREAVREDRYDRRRSWGHYQQQRRWWDGRRWRYRW